MSDKQFSLTSRTIIGIVLLLLGVLFLLDNFAVFDAAAILRYWPVLLVLFGGIKALQPGGADGRIIGATAAVIGVFMLLSRMDILHIDFWALWPLLLIAAGAALVLRTRGGAAELADVDAADMVSGTAVLGGLEQRITSNHFRGGAINAVLGGHSVDLRDAAMPENSVAVLDVFAFMGGVEIRVPRNWSVVVEATALLGGIDNKVQPVDTGGRQLIIRGQAFLAGVDIK